jgi:hypothetical protein
MKQRKPEAMRVLRLAVLWSSSYGLAWGQQSIGTVGVQDATIAGSMEVSNGRAVLVGGTTLTAKDHTAEVALSRGGTLRVCATSGLHIAAGQSTSASKPLMLALDRGAVEVEMPATTSDAVMTPDLRFSLRTNGPLDLQLRVTKNGDTCVDNRGAKAPVLSVADQFGEATYQIQPGQHVLFEHGSLKEVVDNESSPCGCPPVPSVSIADAAISGSGNAATPSTKPDEHPFPQAVSQGLAPTPPVPQAPTGEVHTQVATTLSYSADDSNKAPAATPPAAQTTPPARPPSNNVFHKVGHFFKRIFGGG